MARSMQDLSDGVFINVVNFTLARRDSYLDYLKAGIKQDTLTSLRTAPLHMSALFPDHLITKAEEEIRHHEDKRNPGTSIKGNQRFHPYGQPSRHQQLDQNRKAGLLAWKQLRRRGQRSHRGKTASFSQRPAKTQKQYNDNYCVQSVTGSLVQSSVTGHIKASVSSVVRGQFTSTGKDCFSKTRPQLPVSYHVASHVPFAGGSPQKKGVSPERQRSIKSVKGVSCVNQLSSVHNVTNVPLVVPSPVGSRLHNFWEKWAALGVNPKVVSVLKEGYVLPFQSRPYLTRKPTITSCYVDPHRNSYLLEALHQLLNKNAVELVQNPQSLGFYNRLFLVPKPNTRWRPILDLSNLNKFLKTQTFKMETPETIRTSLQTGEWVTSIDFKDAYFHVPINSQSRKYMCFHIQGRLINSRPYPLASPLLPWSSR